MKKNFTILIPLLCFFYSQSQVTITPAADKGLCIGAAFAPLGSDITITETQVNAFTNGGTYDIRVPVNFEIENGSAVTNISGGNDITLIAVSYPDARTISLLFTTDATENATDQFTITFDIRAVSPASFGTIVRSGGSNASNGFIHGVVSSEQAPSVSGLASSYCSNNGNVTIYGSPSRGTFSGNGITDNADGSALFNPGAGGAGTITFTVSDGICQGVVTPSTIIKPVPFVSITSPSTTDFTSSSPPIVLVGNPGGGAFTGPAVSNNKFYPESAGSGTHTITYTYTNAQGCTGTATRNLTVTPGGNVFSCLPAEICLNNASVIDLTDCPPSIPANQSIFDYVVYNSTSGEYDPLPSGIFNPSNYEQGNHYVGYRVCTNPCGSSPNSEYPEKLQIVYIKTSGSEVYLYPLPDRCLGSANLNLSNYGSPAGGSFTSPDASGAIFPNTGQYFFNPNSAGAGTFTIQYNPPPGACGSAVQQNITVYPTPYETTFQNLTVSGYCYEDTLTLTDLTALDNNIAGQTNLIDRVYWYVDGSFNRITADHVLENKFPLPGTHTVDVYVYSNHGCNNHYQKSISLGAYPKTNFSWINDCYDGTNPPTQFNDASTISFGNIVSRNWYFGEPGAQNLGNSTNPNYLYTSPGKYTAKLVTTSNTGCRDSIEYNNVNIYPVYAPASGAPYIETFRNNDGFWGTTGKPSSWSYGNIAKATITNNKNYWVTNGPDGNYLNAENSQLQSPCFDFTNLHKPMIAMRIWSATPNLIAGTVLEYSTNDGATWSIIGDKGQGEHWYDEIGIAGSPGNTTTNVGWTGTYSGWQLARIGLSSLANQPNVKFRINFGAPNDTNIARSDGFAIDSVWIGERSHVVLLEHFTNTTGGVTAQNANAAIDNIRSLRRNDVAVVQYHTSFPGTEPFASYNFSDPGSRVLYYGVNAIPRTIMDGISYNGNVYSGGTPEQRLDIADIDYQALRRSNFDISMNCLHNTGTSATGIKVRYTQNLPANLVVLHTVMVEDSASGNNGLNGVVRKMLPDATGTIISNWAADSTYEAWFTWNHALPANSKFGVVAYIQDIATKEIYQAAFLKGSGTSGYDIVDGVLDNSEELNGILIYPNPTSSVLNVSLPEKIKGEYSYTIINSLGHTVVQNSSSEHLLSVSTVNLKPGMYTLQISSSAGSTTKKFLVVE